MDIEALARVVEAAADALHTPPTAHQRMVFGRIQALATKTSEQASGGTPGLLLVAAPACCAAGAPE